MNLEGPRRSPQPFPIGSLHACTHSRLISDYVSEEEHNAGKVRCVECGGSFSTPTSNGTPRKHSPSPYQGCVHRGPLTKSDSLY
jgi:hypothetical protein